MFEDPFGDSGDRGVSEVLAFILVFTIILASVTVVSVFGVQSLTSFQEGEQVRNAERAFDALSDNFNDVVRYDGITDRSGELNLRGGSLTTDYEGTEIEIEDDDDLLLFNGEEASFETGGLVYDADQRSDSIIYEGGAIFRSADEGAVTLEQPMVRCNPEEGAIISIVIVEQEAGSFIGSDVNQVSISEDRDETIRTTESVDDELTISFENEDRSGMARAWAGSFEDAGFDKEGEQKVTCDVDQVTIHIVHAEIDF